MGPKLQDPKKRGVKNNGAQFSGTKEYYTPLDLLCAAPGPGSFTHPLRSLITPSFVLSTKSGKKKKEKRKTRKKRKFGNENLLSTLTLQNYFFPYLLILQPIIIIKNTFSLYSKLNQNSPLSSSLSLSFLEMALKNPNLSSPPLLCRVTAAQYLRRRHLHHQSRTHALVSTFNFLKFTDTCEFLLLHEEIITVKEKFSGLAWFLRYLRHNNVKFEVFLCADLLVISEFKLVI